MGPEHRNHDELIARCLGGDDAAAHQLHQAHARWVLTYFLRNGFERGLAEDLTQETFLSAFRSLRTFDPQRGQFGTWLSAIARNAARKHWRRRQNEQFDSELAEAVLADAAEPPSPQCQEELDALGDCVGRLDDEHARLVRLRFVDGLTTRSIAAATGLAESTVRLKLGAAMRALETCLRKKGFMAD